MAVQSKRPLESGFLIAVFALILLKIAVVHTEGQVKAKPETISVVINKNSFQNQDMIQVLDSPSLISDHVILTVNYRCSKQRYAGVEIIATTIRKISKQIFRKIWRCSGGSESPVRRKHILVELPPKYIYSPDRFNTDAVTVSNSTIRAWLLETPRWKQENSSLKDSYARAFVKVSYNTSFLPPFSRPRNNKICLPWSGTISSILDSKKIGYCQREKEIIQAVSYPAALSSSYHGIFRHFTPYSNPDLEWQRNTTLPFFTISMWVYVLEYCPFFTLCSVMHHYSKNDVYLSPVLCFNKEGKLHAQMMLASGQSKAVLTPFIVPKQQWIHIVFAFRKNRWTLDIQHGDNYNKTLSTYLNFDEDVYYDDSEDIFTFGGSELMPSFKGYIGQATFYRNKAYYASELPHPSPYHPMFELDITGREDQCQSYINKVQYRIYQCQTLKKYLDSQVTCKSAFEKFRQSDVPFLSTDQCPVWDGPKSRQHWLVNRLLKKGILNGQTVLMDAVGKAIYDKAVSKIEKSVEKIPFAIKLLKQASCYESYDAMYMLSVIFSNGYHVKADQIQSHAFLMLGALEKHRLSMMSLANKHNIGLDGFPLDKSQAYMYYKYVADRARVDRDKHKDTDIVTESVRLTNELEMREQTDEDGDVFMWMKHQAQQGVLGAQQYVARSLFWGSRGLQRNVNAALEYFRLGAEQQDPVSMYDYGIVLMRGQGTEKNVTKGLELMTKSAMKGNSNALSALGWHALEVEKNYTKAAKYLETAYKLGNPDAGHNIGHMYLTGKYPNSTVNRHKAFEYTQWAALRNQFDAGVLLSQFLMRGTDKLEPDVAKAVEWARFMAEKNPNLGHLLRKALRAYRDGDIALSLFYYMMAADTGSEVANFNLALLCEENKDGLVTAIERECQWHRFNISTQREEHHIDSYALIKMGDFHWYGCEGNKDTDKAMEFYTRAARKRDPHAIFNLAFMVEEGVNLPQSVLRRIGINPRVATNNITLLTELYSRCKESKRTEAYFPCSIALWRIQALDLWDRYRVWMGLSSAIGLAIVSTATLYSIYNYLRGFLRISTGEPTQDTV